MDLNELREHLDDFIVYETLGSIDLDINLSAPNGSKVHPRIDIRNGILSAKFYCEYGFWPKICRFSELKKFNEEKYNEYTELILRAVNELELNI